MVRSFSTWKAQAVLRLLAIKAAHSDPKVHETVDALIAKLLRLRTRDLAAFLVLLHRAAALSEEFLSILPTEEEVKTWSKKRVAENP